MKEREGQTNRHFCLSVKRGTDRRSAGEKRGENSLQYYQPIEASV